MHCEPRVFILGTILLALQCLSQDTIMCCSNFKYKVASQYGCCTTDSECRSWDVVTGVDPWTTTYSYWECPKLCTQSMPITSTPLYTSQYSSGYYYSPDCLNNVLSNCDFANDICHINLLNNCTDTSCYKICTPKCPYKQTISAPCTIARDTQCTDCVNRPGYYWRDITLNCDNDAAWTACDACTKPGDYSTAGLADCPAYDDTKGRDPTTQKCLACGSCPSASYFYNPDPLDITCMTDAASQCYSYRSLPPGNAPVKSGPMPFAWGYQRNPGVQNKNGDTLPWYTPCQAGWNSAPGYVVRSPMVTDAPFGYDCNINSVGMCDVNYYVSKTDSLTNGITCSPCPTSSGHSDGKFQTYCTCDPRFATSDELQSAFGPGQFGVISLKAMQACYDCMGEVQLLQNGNFGVEFIQCSGGAQQKIVRCSGRQIMDGNDGCVTCANGSNPNAMRSVCQKCVAGTFFLNSQCVPCDPNFYFCASEGLLAPTPKRLQCGKGQLLTLSNSAISDNTCGPCPLETYGCGGGSTYVFSKGHNTSNPCKQSMGDGSTLYFWACYQPSVSGGSMETNSQVSTPGYRLQFIAPPQTTGSNYYAPPLISVSECQGLPPYAQWIGTDQVPLACLFSCKYGWDATLGRAYKNLVKTLVYNGSRAELYDFLQHVESAAFLQSMPSTVLVIQKSLWPKYDAGSLNKLQWEQRWSTSMSISQVAYAAYYLENTFMYLDEIGVPTGLCSAPAPTPPCPIGFLYSPGGPLPCVYLAHEYGLYSVSLDGDNTPYYAAIQSATSQNIACLIPQSQLRTHVWIQYSKCVACMDQQQNSVALSVVSDVSLSYWSGVSSWNSLDTSSSPYSFEKQGTCEKHCIPLSASHTVMYRNNVTGVDVCIPCQPISDWRWSSVCGSSFFSASLCLNASVAMDACGNCACDPVNCSGSVNNNPGMLLKWDSLRPTGWGSNILCKFICNANFTSNTDSVGYITKPCISCNDVIRDFKKAGICNGGEVLFLMLYALSLCSTLMLQAYVLSLCSKLML